MLQKFIKLLSIATLCLSLAEINARIMQRSQTVDAARALAGWTNHINLFDMGGLYGSFAIIPEFTRSFDNNRIADNIFGTHFGTGLSNIVTDPVCNTDCNSSRNSDCRSFSVQGSLVADRSANALLADYAGLATDYSSTVQICPKIQNFLVDFNLFLGLDEWLCGMWFRIQVPVVYAKWNLNYCETQVPGSGVTGYRTGYFSPDAVASDNLNSSFGAYLSGSTPTLNNGVTFNALNNSKLCSFNTTSSNSCDNDCSAGFHTTRLSDIEIALGRNFSQDEDYHVGLGLVLRVPTGNRINDAFLFQPVIGNGHHWEIGGLITSRYTFWRSCDNDQSLGMYVDAWITHLFRTTQRRAFDLCCSRGLNNRFMLAQRFTTNVDGGLSGSQIPIPLVEPTPSTSQFAGVYAPVANLTYESVKVSIPVQADVVAMLNYTGCGFTFDLGYNFWGTSCEKIESCGNNILSGQNWALKGDASMYGFIGGSPALSLALGASETGCCKAPLATITSGTNFISGTTTIEARANANIENDQFAFGNNAIPVIAPVFSERGGTVQTRTSIQPVFLSDADIDYCSNRKKGLTHKVFTHLAYTWEECDCYIPYIGIGGFAEFAQNNDRCDNNCVISNCNTESCSASPCGSGNSCANGAFSQWGIWIKGGVSFN